MSTEITVSISGGLVQDIVCTDNTEDVKIIVKDYDLDGREDAHTKTDMNGTFEETVTIFEKK